MSAKGTAGGNRYTKRQNAARSQEVRDAWKDRVQIGVVIERLEAFASGRKRANASQIKAAEVLLDRLVPRLSAVEQTEINELDSLSREEILGRISALLAADSTLLPELVALQARTKAMQPQSVNVDEQSA